MAQMGLPEKTNRTLVLKLPTPLGTHVAALPCGRATLGKRVGVHTAVRRADATFDWYSSHENVGPLLTAFMYNFTWRNYRIRSSCAGRRVTHVLLDREPNPVVRHCVAYTDDTIFKGVHNRKKNG